MAISIKVFALAAALGGGCIGLPLYFLKQSKSTTIASKTSEKPFSENTVREPSTEVSEPSEKVECNISDFLTASEYFKKFLQSHEKEEELYSLLSCTDNTFKEGDSSLLGKNWMGLFPKTSLIEKLSLKTEEKFEMKVTTSNEDAMPRSITVTTFSNPSTKSSIRGIWSDWKDISEEGFRKKVIPMKIEENIKSPKEIYLFIDSKDESMEETAE